MRIRLVLTGVFSLATLATAQVYNDGTQGSVTGHAGDWGATYHASGFLSRGGCLDGASIERCYTARLSGNASAMLETADYPPYVAGGVGTRQRALLLSAPHRKTAFSGIVNHRVYMHIGEAFSDLPPGAEHAITLVGLRNGNSSVGLRAFDLRVRKDAETVGPSLYVSVVTQDGSEDAPAASYPLAQVFGRTLEVKYDLGIGGRYISYGLHVMARLSVRFADTGEALMVVDISEERFVHGIVDADAHWIFYGADRLATPDMQDLEVSFGDYFAAPSADNVPQPPELTPAWPGFRV